MHLFPKKKKDRDNNKTMKTNIDSNILIFWQKQRILQNIVNMSDTCSELMVKNNHTHVSDSYQNKFFSQITIRTNILTNKLQSN